MDVPNAPKKKLPLRAYWAITVGWVCCAWNGKLDRFSWLVAQSYHETDGWKSDLLQRSNNLFGMMSPDPYQNGSTQAADGGMATFGSYWSSWTARLQWDKRRGIECQTGKQYVHDVLEHGYAKDPLYAVKWKAIHAQLPSIVTVWSVDVDGPGASWVRIVALVACVSLLLAGLYAVYLIIKSLRK